MFEYIGEMGKDYIYAVTPLLQVGGQKSGFGWQVNAEAEHRHLVVAVTAQLLASDFVHCVASTAVVRAFSRGFSVL
jgi:hypothetical protein